MDRRLVALKRLLDVMDELRVKCPWDRKQTFESLRMNTIEETYELADAILDHDLDNVKKELGDLLLHVVFYSKMGSEQQAFDIGDVADAICDKLIFRHPHVFGETQAEDAEQVKQNWEDLKLKEKALEHRKKRVLAGVPRSLPALVKAYRIGEKAAAAGFDWEKREGELSIHLQNDAVKNRGIGTAAERLLLAYAFDELGLTAVTARVIEKNTRSRRVLEKVGFVFVRQENGFLHYRCEKISR